MRQHNDIKLHVYGNKEKCVYVCLCMCERVSTAPVVLKRKEGKEETRGAFPTRQALLPHQGEEIVVRPSFVLLPSPLFFLFVCPRHPHHLPHSLHNATGPRVNLWRSFNKCAETLIINQF